MKRLFYQSNRFTERAPNRRAMKRRRFGASKKRQGSAAIEFVLVVPVLVALTLGTMDVCSAMFLKESAILAAYEGARQGVSRGNSNIDVTNQVREFLDERGIEFDGDVVTISQPGFDTAATLEPVTVTVTIPATGNLLMPTAFMNALDIRANVTLVKEYQNIQN